MKLGGWIYFDDLLEVKKEHGSTARTIGCESYMAHGFGFSELLGYIGPPIARNRRRRAIPFANAAL